MRFTGGIQNRAIIPITRRSDKVTGRKVGGWIQRRLRVSPVAFLAQESMEQAELEAPSQTKCASHDGSIRHREVRPERTESRLLSKCTNRIGLWPPRLGRRRIPDPGSGVPRVL